MSIYIDMEIEMCDSFFYRVKNDNVFSIFNTCKDNILRNNKEINIYNGEWVKIKLNNFVIHHVKPMQTIEQIAKIYNLDCKQLMLDNNLVNKKLFIGQQLKIFNK